MKLHMPQTNGSLHLAFTRPADNRPTSLKILVQTPPLRVIRPFITPDGAALVHLHNVSGGILGGDQLVLRADLAPRTYVQLTTTGATRVYRQRTGQPAATQTTHLRVGSGARLEYLPDPLIPFADAAYRQETHIELAANSGLFYWDVIAPGRAAHSEQFEYERLQMNLDIRGDGRPIALERLCLEPGSRPPASLVRLGAHAYFGTFYICCVGTPASIWLDLEQQLAILAQNLSTPTSATWGVSALVAHGLVVRAVGNSTRALQAGLLQFWQHAKQALYQADAIPPRKL